MTNYQIDSREWWVQRWLELLDSYRFKKRLERARIYAREGNVLSIEFKGAQVLAKIQGSEAEPYQVSLSLTPFTDEDWGYVIETMSQKAIFSAQLLAGEMPPNIEDVFTANGLTLFPFSLSEIHSHCTCPDKANPCKHIGAVYYQLGDRFSEDPFVLFRLRGRTKAQILDTLRQLRSRDVGAGSPEALSSKDISPINLPSEEQESRIAQEQSQIPNPKTTLNIEQFWKYDEPLESSLVVIAPSPESKTVLDILGAIPLAYSDAQVLRKYLEQVYQTAPQQAMMSALNREE
ncbi:MAG: SWIM zinc finger family protein [Xenococcaceae cyanobacterium]